MMSSLIKLPDTTMIWTSHKAPQTFIDALFRISLEQLKLANVMRPNLIQNELFKLLSVKSHLAPSVLDHCCSMVHLTDTTLI